MGITITDRFFRSMSHKTNKNYITMNNAFLSIVLTAISISTNSYAEDDRDKRFPVDSTYESNIQSSRLVGTLTNLHNIIDRCEINPSPKPTVLEKNYTLEDLKYKKIFGQGLLSDFEKDSDMLGITMVDNGIVVRQKFFKERKLTDVMPSFSMSKSLVSLLIGAAYDDGSIESLDDKAGKYSDNLKDTPYGDVKIVNLLRMSSGVPFSEDYSANSDIAQFSFGSIGSNSNVVDSIKKFNRVSKNEGMSFNYASIETAVLAELLRGKVGNLCEYFEKKIWQPIGASSKAYWAVDSNGKVAGHAFFMSQQDDFVKIGIMLANNGFVNNKQVISKEYLDLATLVSKQPEGFQVGKVNRISGYGFQMWLSPTPGIYSMWGVRGQRMYIDTNSKRVMLINSAWQNHIDQIGTYKIDQIFKSFVKTE
jgi:CubicO group peptidase (beta-lactamase class C family)